MTTSTNPSDGSVDTKVDDSTGASRPPLSKRAFAAIDERLGLSSLQYPVPQHANTLGGLTAASFGILLITGLILTQFYRPRAEAANQSVRTIVTDTWGGLLFRGVHFWAAQAMFVLAALHLLRIFVSASYRRPREGNWLIGVAMFGLIIGAIFTGTVLKWDQEGFEALGHNLEIAKLLGGLGFWFTSDLSPNVPLLTRLYVAHIAIIPAMITGLIVIHAALVKRHGVAPLPDSADAGNVDEPTGSFARHGKRLGAFSLVLLGGLAILAVLFPPVLGSTPIEGIEVTKPLWMFWWVYTLENWIGLKGILWGMIALFSVLIAIPFVDRNKRRSWRRRPVAMSAFVIVLVGLIWLSLITGLGSTAQHLG